MSTEREGTLPAAIQAWDLGTWCLAAVALTGRSARPNPVERDLHDAAAQVLTVLGLLDPSGAFSGAGVSRPDQLAAQAAIPLLLTSSLLGGQSAWAGLSDDALLAQGTASGQMAPAFRDHLLPLLPGLEARLAQPGARMLDVGTGVGAIAVAFARTFPALTVVGIDVMERVLRLAETAVAASDVAERVSVRQQDIAALDEQESYDLAWLPGPFVPSAAVQAGLPRLVRALRPGGWLLLGHGTFADDPLESALNRFKTLAYGGVLLDDAAAASLLSGAGLVDVTTLATPPGAPAITVGRRG